MPRKGAPEGCVDYTTACQMLIDAKVMVSTTMIYKIWENYGFVTVKPSDLLTGREKERAKIKKRERGFYRLVDLQRVIEHEKVFQSSGLTGTWKNNNASTFRQATADDMPAIVDMSLKIFCEPPTLETRLRWLTEEPESFFVLCDQAGTIVGYSSIIAVEEREIKAFTDGLLDSSEMTALRFLPGRPLHLYVMALAIDPQYPRLQKHTYGSALLRGLLRFFFTLAERGVDIVTVTARSNRPDGVKLAKDLSIPQLVSKVPGKKFFSVNVADNGHEVFEQYRYILSQH